MGRQRGDGTSGVRTQGSFFGFQEVLRSVWVDVWVDIVCDFRKASKNVP